MVFNIVFTLFLAFAVVLFCFSFPTSRLGAPSPPITRFASLQGGGVSTLVARLRAGLESLLLFGIFFSRFPHSEEKC